LKPLAEIGDLVLRLLVLLLGGVERHLDGGQLAAQRRDLLVEDLDLRQRPGGDFLLAFELAGEFGDLALRRGGARAGALGQALEFVAIARGGSERGLQLRELVFQIGLAGLLQRQQFGELGDLRVEAGQRGILAGDFLLQIELHHHEHGQDEDDAEDQRRQRIDEARPVVHAAFAAARSCKRHDLGHLSTFSRTMTSSSFLISRCCSAWLSTQSRIICCSLRM